MNPEEHRLLTAAEVADLFRVDPRTVTRWALSGRLESIRTPGGHRRFSARYVRELLRGDDTADEAADDTADEATPARAVG